MSRPTRTTEVAVLPDGWSYLYLVIGENCPDIHVRRFEDKRNIQTNGEYVSLYWPEDATCSRYDCAGVFETESLAIEEAKTRIMAWQKRMASWARHNLEKLT
jgi:hypothetical protein